MRLRQGSFNVRLITGGPYLSTRARPNAHPNAHPAAVARKVARKGSLLMSEITALLMSDPGTLSPLRLLGNHNF
jgi:hypothetical protein